MDIKKLKDFYKNKRVFVTGHTGFKGTWLCLILNYLGANVIGYSLKQTPYDNFDFYKAINLKKNNFILRQSFCFSCSNKIRA